MDPTSLLTVIEKPHPTSDDFLRYGYRFDDAVADASGEGEIGKLAKNTVVLWKSGCQLDDGSWNCTTACFDEERGPKLVWDATGNMTTLQNCLIYPMLTEASAKGLLVGNDTGLLDRYGISFNQGLRHNASDILPGSPVVNKCIQSFCDIVYDGTDHDCSSWRGYETSFAVGDGLAPWIPKLVNQEIHGLQTHLPSCANGFL